MFSKQQKTVLAVVGALAALLLAAAVFVLVRHFTKTDPPQNTESTAEATASETASDTASDTGITTVVVMPSESGAETAATTAAPPTTAAPAVDTAKIVAPTEKELKEVTQDGGFLNVLNLTFMPESTGNVTVDFDCAKLNTAAVKKYLFFLNYSRIYIAQYGEPQNVSADLGNTGKKQSYWVYPEENIIWLARNVLNYTGEFDRKAFEAGGSGNNPSPCTYQNGMFWFSIPGFDTFQAYPDKISASPLADGKYKLTVSYQYFFDFDDTRPVPGSGEVIVAMKEANGKRFWSVYTYKAQLNITYGDPDPAQTKQSFEDILSAFREKWRGADYRYSEYAYHDIDEDGTNELIVHDGTCEADRAFYFYAMRNGSAVELGTVFAWHATLVDNDKRLLVYSGMGGEGTYSYIYISGDEITETLGGSFTFPPVPDFGTSIDFIKVN